jgi:hypothetical protein
LRIAARRSPAREGGIVEDLDHLIGVLVHCSVGPAHTGLPPSSVKAATAARAASAGVLMLWRQRRGRNAHTQLAPDVHAPKKVRMDATR